MDAAGLREGGRGKGLTMNAHKKEIGLLTLGMILLLTGYGLLLWVDWRLALAVFCINWVINLDASRQIKAIHKTQDVIFRTIGLVNKRTED